MLKWPFQRLSDLQLGDQKVTLNHLVIVLHDACFAWVWANHFQPPSNYLTHWTVECSVFGAVRRETSWAWASSETNAPSWSYSVPWPALMVMKPMDVMGLSRWMEQQNRQNGKSSQRWKYKMIETNNKLLLESSWFRDDALAFWQRCKVPYSMTIWRYRLKYIYNNSKSHTYIYVYRA